MEPKQHPRSIDCIPWFPGRRQ